MGFRNEIDEVIRLEEENKRLRQLKVQAITEYCKNNDVPFSEIDKDKILHPEDYDDYGNRMRFTDW